MPPWRAGAASVMNHWPEWPHAGWCMEASDPQRSGSSLSPWLGKTSQDWLLVHEWSPPISGWTGEEAPGMGVFSSPLLNNKPPSSVVWLVVYQLDSDKGSAALPAICWGWKVQDGDLSPEFGVSARLGNHWGCWLGLSVFMASLGFLTASPSQSSLTWWLLPRERKLPVSWKAGLGTDTQHHLLCFLLAKQVARPYLIHPEEPDMWAAANVHREEQLMVVTFGDFYRTLGFLPQLVETQVLPLGRMAGAYAYIC